MASPSAAADVLPLFSSEPVHLDKAYMLGIDEAGRGPVLGPMVYAAAYWPVDELSALKKMGFDDSKVLKPEERERLFALIRARNVGFRSDVLHAADLSAKMLRLSKYNLNAISHNSAIGLIEQVLARGVHVTEVYVDTVGPPHVYESMLKTRFPHIARITVSKKADSLFPIVSAASICAKVLRDEILTRWEFPERGLDVGSVFGSGYPADPLTKEWLKRSFEPVFGFPSLIRFSWKTTTNLLDDGIGVQWDNDSDDEVNNPSAWTKRQKASPAKRTKSADADDDDGNGQADDDDGDGDAAAAKGKRKAARRSGVPLFGKPAERRHRYFAERRMTRVETFEQPRH